MATFYGAVKLTGGVKGALDRINGSKLGKNDVAIVITDVVMYGYQVAVSNASENVPFVIKPDRNPGDKRWMLVASVGASGANDHNTLINKGVYTHAEIDTHIDDIDKHRTISDATSGSTELWSAQKIATEINNLEIGISGNIDGGDYI